ncbi:hypothetical protein ALC60_01536 [Trachymyrmex zeteki]|uniref:Uncharacterized protein n=1 Tax=Mycetomoellerius zeteki TaxID=64791 RepID=A0A151XGW7_9HYME|nr:hypothetical protein ALC60_01536 [Trachymyrmex zeteki]
MLGKLFRRKHKRSRMYYACVRSTLLFYMDARPQYCDQHAANICTISAEIDERQSRKGVVNYVHNFQLLTLSIPATDDPDCPEAPNLSAPSARSTPDICSPDAPIASRMGIVSFVFVCMLPH